MSKLKFFNHQHKRVKLLKSHLIDIMEITKKLLFTVLAMPSLNYFI
jgi:hypothetical protein